MLFSRRNFFITKQEDVLITLDKLIFGNGAGSIKTMQHVVEACRGPMTRITVGSITKEERAGNVGDVYYFDPTEKWSMNSLGLPNIGIAKYRDTLPYMVQKAHEHGKELWASVSGSSPEENLEMALSCWYDGVDGVELNLSCPNVWGPSGRKAIPALDWELTYKIVVEIRGRVGGAEWDKLRHRLALKLSPTDDEELINKLAIITANHGIGWLTIGNTIPDQERLREDGKPALAFRSNDQDTVVKHKGGLAGSAVKKANTAMVRALRLLLPEQFRITGVGGIFDAADAYEYLEAGASAFQCTTGYIEYGNRVFESILPGLSDMLSDAA